MLSRRPILPIIPRSLLLVASAIFVAAVALNSGVGESAFGNVGLPFREARLLLAPPDQALAMPVQGVQVRCVADTWHAARSGARLHEGQDIFAPRGTPVFAATAGIVIRVRENTLGGRTVSVLGAGGRVYYYAHLDRYAEGLSIGDEVTPETVLGYVGTMGNAKGTPPHLHFGVYTPGGAVNPLPLLADRVRSRHDVRPAKSANGRSTGAGGAGV